MEHEGRQWQSNILAVAGEMMGGHTKRIVVEEFSNCNFPSYV